MKNNFNLVKEPWIPVDAGFISLHQLFSDSTLKKLSGNPVEKIALTKLLLAIAQAACTPENDDEWLTLSASGLSQKCVAYLEKWHDSFYLYGDKPFLQMPAVAKAEIKPFSAFIPNIATGNSTVLTEYNIEAHLDDKQKALLLVTQMSMALGGKKADNSIVLTPGYKEKKKSSKPGSGVAYMGMLHSFITGSTLQETIWLNLFTKNNEFLEFFEYDIGIPPWEHMPQGEDDAIAQKLKNSLMGRLIPLCRFCLLADNGIHITEGIQHLNYKEGLFDPSITINKTLKEYKVIWTDPTKRPWRNLTAFLGYLNNEQNYECFQLHLTIPRACTNKISCGVWAGGFRVSSNAGEQYATGKNDYVESHLNLPIEELKTIWFKKFEQAMANLENQSKRLYGCISSYFKKQMVDGKEQAAKATQLFWQMCEQHAQNLINDCDDAEKLQILERKFSLYLIQLYDQTCSNQTAKQIAIWAQCHPFLSKKST